MPVAPEKLAKLPSRELAKWIEKHSEIVADVDYEGGYCTNSRSDKAYDVLLADGYSDLEGYHIIIESSARAVLGRLRTVTPCEGDCECKQR